MSVGVENALSTFPAENPYAELTVGNRYGQFSPFGFDGTEVRSLNNRIDAVHSELSAQIDNRIYGLRSELNGRMDRLRDEMLENYHRLDSRMRTIEQGFARIDQRLETLERAIIPSAEPAQ